LVAPVNKGLGTNELSGGNLLDLTRFS